MASPLFLLGAGFNFDAPAAAEPIVRPNLWGQMVRIDASYPLVSDLWRICFDETPTAAASIEERFHAALSARNYEPLQRLYKKLFEADNYLARSLSDPQNQSWYSVFFDSFPDATYLTFNYDCLAEAFLYRRGRWQPDDGFGVPVETRRKPVVHQRHSAAHSTSVVFHLHGSLCVYTQMVDYVTTQYPGSTVTELLPRQPRFHFDPHSLGGALFAGYARPLGVKYVRIERRVIAPVRDKSNGLRGKFVKAVYRQAIDLLKATDQLATIGYSFNPNDRASYHPLLDALSGKCALVVAPDARRVVARIARAYPLIQWRAADATFREWVLCGFPGLKVWPDAEERIGADGSKKEGSYGRPPENS